MKVIGITGGAGSGKSYVSQCIREHFGYPVIDSDSVARELMEPGQKAYMEVVREFGSEILCEDGTIDRKKLAVIVFNDSEKLELLNRLTHPVTIDTILERIRAYEAQGLPVVFVESALADKAGYRGFCDELWLVHASEEVRAERLRRTRGYSDEKIEQVMSNQSTMEELLRCCTKTIRNDGYDNDSELLEQLTRLLNDLLLDDMKCICSLERKML